MEDLENRFLSRLEKNPADVRGLTSFLEPLAKQNPFKVQTCAALLDDMLKEKALLKERWFLAKWRARVLDGHGFGWEEALAVYREAGPVPENFDAVSEVLMKDYKKFPERTLTTLEEVCALAPEMVVRFQGKPARIHEVNIGLKVVKVRLEGASLVSVPFGAAGKFIRRLAPTDAPSRAQADPEALRRLAQEDPKAFLKQVLRHPHDPISFDDIRELLKGLLPEENLVEWWDEAADAIPLVRLPGGKKTIYQMVESPEAVEQMARGIDLSKRLNFIAANARYFPALAPAFRELVKSGLEAEDAAAAYRAFKLLRKIFPDEGTGWDMLFRNFTPQQLYAGLSGSRDRLNLIQEVSDKVLLAAFFKKEDNTACLEALWEKLGDEGLVSELLHKPDASPSAFLFLMGRVGSDAFMTGMAEKMGPGLLMACLEAYRTPAFARLLQALHGIWDAKVGAGYLMGLIAHEEEAREMMGLLEELDEMHVHAAPVTVLKSRLIVRFPGLKKAEDVLWCTEVSLRRKHEELDRIVKEEIPRFRTMVKEARELGDLSENFEYKSARERHEQLQHAASRLDAELKRARPLKTPPENPSAVCIGSVVGLSGVEGDRQEITLLGPWESDPNLSVYSYESDAGKALLDKEVGDDILLFGRMYTITSIKAWRKG